MVRPVVQKKENEDLNFDKRVMQRNIAEGRVSREEADAHIKALPDMSEFAQDISAKIYGEEEESEESQEN
jgi:hypothetical protein